MRRAAIGVVQPLIEHDVDFDLTEAVKRSAKTQSIEANDDAQKQILEFISRRLKVVLGDLGYKHDVVEAVLAAQPNNPAGTLRAVKQLSAWVEREDWKTILDGFARCVRILRSQTEDKGRTIKVNEKMLVDAEEKELYKAIKTSVLRPRSMNSLKSSSN